MAEHRRTDRNALDRAPEEAAIDTWLDDSDVYLTIPGNDLARQSLDRPRTEASSFTTLHRSD